MHLCLARSDFISRFFVYGTVECKNGQISSSCRQHFCKLCPPEAMCLAGVLLELIHPSATQVIVRKTWTSPARPIRRSHKQAYLSLNHHQRSQKASLGSLTLIEVITSDSLVHQAYLSYTCYSSGVPCRSSPIRDPTINSFSSHEGYDHLLRGVSPTSHAAASLRRVVMLSQLTFPSRPAQRKTHQTNPAHSRHSNRACHHQSPCQTLYPHPASPRRQPYLTRCPAQGSCRGNLDHCGNLDPGMLSSYSGFECRLGMAMSQTFGRAKVLAAVETEILAARGWVLWMRRIAVVVGWTWSGSVRSRILVFVVVARFSGRR